METKEADRNNLLKDKKQIKKKEVMFRLEYNEKSGLWHYEWLKKTTQAKENTLGWATIAKKEPYSKLRLFTNSMRLFKKGHMSVESAKLEWKKFNYVFRNSNKLEPLFE